MSKAFVTMRYVLVHGLLQNQRQNRDVKMTYVVCNVVRPLPLAAH